MGGGRDGERAGMGGPAAFTDLWGGGGGERRESVLAIPRLAIASAGAREYALLTVRRRLIGSRRGRGKERDSIGPPRDQRRGPDRGLATRGPSSQLASRLTSRALPPPPPRPPGDRERGLLSPRARATSAVTGMRLPQGAPSCSPSRIVAQAALEVSPIVAVAPISPG